MINYFSDQNLVEQIHCDGKALALIIRKNLQPEETTFLTPPEFTQQVGFVVYPAGGQIARHVHRPLKRQITGTMEVIIVRRGRCEVEIFNDSRELVASRELHAGDVILMIAGGHGFNVLEDTILLEIKQGPYTGLTEKDHF